MGFLHVGEGCGIVVNDTAATKLNGLNKKVVSSAAIPFSPRQGMGAACCGGGSTVGLPLEPPVTVPCPPWLAGQAGSAGTSLLLLARHLRECKSRLQDAAAFEGLAQPPCLFSLSS